MLPFSTISFIGIELTETLIKKIYYYFFLIDALEPYFPIAEKMDISLAVLCLDSV